MVDDSIADIHSAFTDSTVYDVYDGKIIFMYERTTLGIYQYSCGVLKLS